MECASLGDDVAGAGGFSPTSCSKENFYFVQESVLWACTLVFGLLLLVPAPLSASPILITISQALPKPAHITVRIMRSLETLLSMTGVLKTGNIQPDSGAYAPGTILDVAGYWLGSDVSANVIFEDEAFRVNSLLFGIASLRFSGGSITLPALADTVTLETPFTFSGNVQERLSPSPAI